MISLRRLALAALVLCSGTLGATAVADAAPRTVIFNLTDSPQERPSAYSFCANGGCPDISGLRWVGWGTRSATGTGSFTGCPQIGSSQCSTEEVVTYRARYVLSGFTDCPRLGAGSHTYRYGKIVIEKPGAPRTLRAFTGADSCAAGLTSAHAQQAAERYVLERVRARNISVTCTPALDERSKGCTARFTVGGKRRSRDLFVFARLHRTPLVRDAD